MEVEFAFLAKRVNVEPSGRVMIEDFGLGTYGVTQLPEELPTIFCVVQMKGTTGESGTRHDIELGFVAPDGTRLFTAHTIESFEASPFRPDLRGNASIAVRDVVLDQLGIYEVHVLLNERLVWTIPFHVFAAG